jgi:hypothetical protein
MSEAVPGAAAAVDNIVEDGDEPEREIALGQTRDEVVEEGSRGAVPTSVRIQGEGEGAWSAPRRTAP